MNNIVAPRKLTDAETSKLRSLLKSKLHLPNANSSEKQQADEDAADLLDYAFAMIANGKNVGYVVEELKSMEMEVCDAASAQMLGRTLANFLGLISNDSDAKGVGAPNPKHEEESGGEGGANNNALASSGALGTSRVKIMSGGGGGGHNFHSDVGVGGGGGRHGSGGGRGNHDNRSRSLLGAAFDRLKPQDHHRDRKNAGGGYPPHGRGAYISPGRGGGGMARGGRFGSGRGGRGRDHSRGGGGGGHDGVGGRQGNNNTIGGRNTNFRGGERVQGQGGEGAGRRDHHPSGNINRDGRGGRERNNHNNDLAGRRRGREDEEEQDFISSDMDRGLTSGREGIATYNYAAAGRGRGYGNGRDHGRGRGRGGGRDTSGARDSGRGRGRGGRGVSGQQQHSKRPRYIEDIGNNNHHRDNNTREPQLVTDDGRNMVDQGYEASSSSWGGRGRFFYRGGRGGRGRSGRGGRGGESRIPNTNFYPNQQSAINNEHITMANNKEEYAIVESTSNATKEAAAVSESPLIAASFGYAPAAGRGRGGRGRGSFFSRGGRGARGRGFGRGGRAGRSEVAEMISAKTWKRPGTMDEGLTTQR